MMRDPYCPVYYYWAGMVVSDLDPGVYNYRLVLELEKPESKDKIYLHMEQKPSLKIIPMNA